MPRIFLTHDQCSRDLWYGEKALKALQGLGEVILRDESEPLTERHLSELAAGCDIIISDRVAPAGDLLFSQIPSLKAFVRCAMDIRSVDVDAATRHGVLVTRAGPGFVYAVTEWIIAQMINLARSIPDYIVTYRRGDVPAACSGNQLFGKTVGILGYGNIARQLIPVLKALGLHVLVHDPWKPVNEEGIEALGQEELLQRSDFAICLVSYSSETEKMFDEKAFSHMPESAFFINAARGGVVDEEDLLNALDCGAIRGAALDVGLGEDNTPTMKLASHPRVLATPHVGGMVPEAIQFQAMQTVTQVDDLLAGRMPMGIVNTELAKQMGLSVK
ncbi:NAD(P)-dependent oxidoreductase [Cobetia marina]|uniref:NAD(P)-dependent oxidoreductase n=1 Tax=Cobetia marina TaxID=28258 RepID=UPI0026E46AEF|nr:NAD(P)-dependent oxidoreductase [Cobetia marina]MDO6788131.1 NAD(P)-dependent oxidoreductase [Cobetia marina]